jgi:hypothetical protein
MKRNWVVIEHRQPNRWGVKYASINPDGVIQINRRTLETLGEPDSVILMYDTESQTIGIKPARSFDRNTFPLRKKGKHGGRIVRAYQLLKEFNIKLTATLKFAETTIENGILLLDLKKTIKARNTSLTI